MANKYPGRCAPATWQLLSLLIFVGFSDAATASDLTLVPTSGTAALRGPRLYQSSSADEPLSIQLDSEVLDTPADDAALESISLDDGVLPEPIPQMDLAVATDDDTPIIQLFGYNSAGSNTTWLPGDNDRFGFVSLENLAVLQMGSPGGVVGGIGVHFLDGPARTEMPPRLFDFTVGYQRREWIRPNIGWDFAFRIGAFSDFEGSAKDGVRFPSHVVGVVRLDPNTTWLAGIDYLDRDDISLLPVLGILWTPTDDFRLDAAFPRPRIALRVMESGTWLYIAGELGGGTWAIERNEVWNDNATYRDVRLIFGIETSDAPDVSSAFEIGYVFDRELSYRSGVGDYSPQECLMIRLVDRY